MAKATKATKAKQLEVPGTEKVVDEEIEAAAGALRETRRSRLELQATEAEQEGTLVEVLAAKGVTLYQFDDGEESLVVRVNNKTKVSITKAKVPAKKTEE